MTKTVGIIGCGNISDIYLINAPKFRDIAVTACADLNSEAAQRQATKYGVAALSVDELLKSEDVGIVLNLTIPDAHADVSLRAIDAGKHVYSEKPLATTLPDGQKILAAANAKGLRVGCAPDTVLGAGYQEARTLIDAGAIGKPLTGLAAFLSHGMEHWHPNPTFFFKPGAGPVFDMGPYYLSGLVTLLGPVAEVQAVGQIGFAERLVTTPGSPILGQSVKVETLTSVQALLSFASGAHVTFLASWDVWRHGLSPIELHGETGSMRLPDPNFFAGDISIAEGHADWRKHGVEARTFGVANWPREKPTHSNYRGLGLADMARGIIDNRAHRASGAVALHVLAIMEGVLNAAVERKTIIVGASCERPPALSGEEGAGLLNA